MKRGVALAVVVALIALCATPLRSGERRGTTEPGTVAGASITQRELCVGPAVQHARRLQSAAHAKLRVFSSGSRIEIDRRPIVTLEGFEACPRAWLPDQRDAIRRVCRRRHAAPSADPAST